MAIFTHRDGPKFGVRVDSIFCVIEGEEEDKGYSMICIKEDPSCEELIVKETVDEVCAIINGSGS